MSASDQTDNTPQEILFEVLESQSTLDNVRSFLQKKKLPHSASSWQSMIEKRIEPALKNGAINNNDIISIIRESEEHGNKHVRLFTFDNDYLDELVKALDSKAVATWAADNDLPQQGEYIFTAYPDEPVVSEVRVGDGEDSDSLIIKIARTEYRRKRGELTKFNGKEMYISERIPFRAVDVLKLKTNGVLEVRLNPRREPPISYAGFASSAISRLQGLVEIQRIAELSLSSAKDSFSDLKKKKKVTESFELYETQHKNDNGDRIQSTSQSDRGGILSSDRMTGVIEQFTVDDPGAYCEKVRVSYRFEEDKKINAILSEDTNEVIFTAKLSRDEFEEVLSSILDVNSDQ